MRNAEARAKENGFSAQLAVIAGMRLNLDSEFMSEDAAVAEHIPAMARARLLIAQDDTAAALRLLEPVRLEAEQRHWHDERLNCLIVEALAWSAHGGSDRAARAIDAALTLAAPAGYMRPFLDEGVSVVALLQRAVTCGVAPHFTTHLLECAARPVSETHDRAVLSSPVLPLSERELDVLRLIAEGLSNQAIADRLFLALDTVKGCNRRIFDKLEVERRTEAVARARVLGLL